MLIVANKSWLLVFLFKNWRD